MESRNNESKQRNDDAVVDKTTGARRRKKIPARSSRAGMVKNPPVQESRPFQRNARGKTPCPLGERLADEGCILCELCSRLDPLWLWLCLMCL